MSLRVHYLNGGYCRHLLASIDGRSWRKVTFQAVFLAIEHPRLGWIVCDTGYGTRFFEATRRWPYRLYRWATPVTLRGTAASALAKLGVRPEEVQRVIVTHFHADHIGGLAEFATARVHHHEEALAPLLARRPLGQTRAAFLPALLPADLARRSEVLAAKRFQPDPALPFASCDVFGDGSLKAVALPGHAPGQIGLEYESRGGRTLYCADAFWRMEQISGGVNLPAPVLALQWDSRAYRETVDALRELARSGTHRLLACHDEETQRHVTP
jgi:glyoxylase-like metal-dependent hydrolase (beta-lactamase superfamily II)